MTYTERKMTKRGKVIFECHENEWLNCFVEFLIIHFK